MTTNTDQWNLYRLDEPQRITAGFVGLREPFEEVFFDCCACGEEDAVIHGYMALSPQREDVAILSRPDGSHARPAYYCGQCWQNLLAESD